MNLPIQLFLLLFFPNSEFNFIKSTVDSDYALNELKHCLATKKHVFVEMKSEKLHAIELYIFYSNIPTDRDVAFGEKKME